LLGLIGDVTLNFGKIHKGVSLEGIDLGGMTRADAAIVLEEQLNPVINSAFVDLFASEQLKSEGTGEATVELTGASTSYDVDEENQGNHSWQISPATVNATIDGAALAEEAYAVGRGGDFFFGRLKANTFGVEVGGFLTYEPAQLETLETLLSNAIGWQVENSNISFEDGSFIAVRGQEGYGVEHGSFVAQLDCAFLGSDRTVVVPMVSIPLVINDATAIEVAVFAQTAIEQPVTLSYEEEDLWTLNSGDLGSWITTSIVGEGDEAELVPHVAEDKLEEGIRSIIGDRDPGIQPQSARFEIVDDQPTVVASTEGSGIDYAQVTADLNAVLFLADEAAADEAAKRHVALTIMTLEPSVSTTQANEMHITEKIMSYTTEYPLASNAKIANVHLAADLLDNSLIEPGGVWSFNDTAGECTVERGFQKATAIVGGEYVDEIGGGICQVATTVYNAVFDSGLPIVERANHGFYLLAYPAGRDAAISWRVLDLKFENDTENWILLTMSYTGTTVTCTLWGTNPGYRVESEDTGFTDRTDYKTKWVNNPELAKGEERLKQTGVRGRTIVVTRYVYNSEGELLRKADFRSVYEPETEIIEVGTKGDGA
jgi:vancomycin resistance protein YoaR